MSQIPTHVLIFRKKKASMSPHYMYVHPVLLSIVLVDQGIYIIINLPVTITVLLLNLFYSDITL